MLQSFARAHVVRTEDASHGFFVKMFYPSTETSSPFAKRRSGSSPWSTPSASTCSPPLSKETLFSIKPVPDLPAMQQKVHVESHFVDLPSEIDDSNAVMSAPGGMMTRIGSLKRSKDDWDLTGSRSSCGSNKQQRPPARIGLPKTSKDDQDLTGRGSGSGSNKQQRPPARIGLPKTSKDDQDLTGSRSSSGSNKQQRPPARCSDLREPQTKNNENYDVATRAIVVDGEDEKDPWDGGHDPWSSSSSKHRDDGDKEQHEEQHEALLQSHHQPADGTGSSSAIEHRLHEMMRTLLTKLESG